MPGQTGFTGIADNTDFQRDFTTYYDPNSQEVRVDFKNEQDPSHLKVELLNLNGQLLSNMEIKGESFTTSTATLSKGVYFVRVISDKVQASSKIFIY